MTALKCRFCANPLTVSFADLGMSPLSNAYIKPGQETRMEPFYPLHAYVCERCFLVQLGEFESPEAIFSDYAYFSSFSDSWLEHCERYTEAMIQRFGLKPQSRVIELASNDGYLLQYFNRRGIQVLGIEPAANVARVAQEKGVNTLVRFFGMQTAEELAAQGIQADLLTANNVLAHVPDLRDFVAGIGKVLKPAGVFTIEFPHLLQLVRENQFDTIYHEHFSYFSFQTIERVFAAFDLTLFDVEQISTHGGSLRVYGRHEANADLPISQRVAGLRLLESEFGLDRLETYQAFNDQIKKTKRQFLKFLIEAREQGKTIVGYGAPAKGNTLLNYCGVGPDLLDYTVDRNPYKQGCRLPGTRIPVCHPDKLKETRPDYVLLLPWNLRQEVMEQHGYIREWGGRFVVPIPEVRILKDAVLV